MQTGSKGFMRNILAITACLKRCSVAISYANKTFEINENIDATANLACLANKLLKSHNVDLKKLDGVITSSGPGSFTGIRTAQSLAKGISLALKIPAASMDYFDVINNLAYQKKYNQKMDRLVLIKSEKDQVYFKLLKSDNSLIEMGISSYENLEEKIARQNNLIIISDIDLENASFLKQKTHTIDFISDFKNAKYLLDFAKIITTTSSINPLYINASS
jgi:tRNA threonylcarbamoyl adenosine modification protein YeaZ